MIHDVSIPAALIAGIVSFLSPCVLPLVPPYPIYLTGATIEHVATGEQAAASKRAVMLSASVIGGLIRAWSAQLSILRGSLFLTGGMSDISIRLLETFPALQNFG
jgi:cytochrome c-type biogenesis protein